MTPNFPPKITFTSFLSPFWQFLKRFRSISGNVIRGLQIAYSSNPRLAIASLTLSILRSLIHIAQLWATKMIIDAIVNNIKLAQAGNSPDMRALITALTFQGVLWLVQEMLNAYSNDIDEMLISSFQMEVEKRILQKISSLDLAFYENPKFYDRLENARSAIDQLGLAFRNLIWLAQGILTPIGMLAVLARLHWLMMPMVLLLNVPWLIIHIRFAEQRWRKYTQRAPQLRMRNYLARLLTSRDAAKEVRLFGLDAEFVSRSQKIWSQFYSETKHLILARSHKVLLLNLISVIGTMGLYVYVISQAMKSRITLGDVTMYLSAIRGSGSGLVNIFGLTSRFFETGLFWGNLFAFLDLNRKDIEGSLSQFQPKSIQLHTTPVKIQQGFEFRNVSFRYPNTSYMVLKNVSFKIQPKEKVALVGENGSGKTTLVKLLCRLYDPTAGEIYLDGYPLKAFNPVDIYKKVGVIFQDFVKYQLTVRENIGFGQLNLLDDFERIRLSAKLGGALELVERLPDKYETVLGKEFEGSVDLSGGEWQKLALSRAFMREAEVLILDEPTAALDVRSEYEIFQRFASLAQGKMVLFISHRFSTVQMADRILVLMDGEILEEGDHETLIAQKGLYAELFAMQAERYLNCHI
jgi:ATP-binding cassette subfamily B protein